MGEIAVLGTSGDTKVKWDPKDPEDTERARVSFVEMVKKGFLFFTKTPSGFGKGTKVDSFDPKAEELIAVPPVRGG